MNTTEAIAKVSADLFAELEVIGDRVLDSDGKARYTLADAIREGSSVSKQSVGAWSKADGSVCALSAAAAAIEARGL